jgi:hypothetical protein
MPRSFEVSVDSLASVEQVHGAFGEEDYWSSRFAAFGTVTTVESLDVGSDGTVTVSTIQDLRRNGLPKLLAKFYPGDLMVRSTETWQPIGDRQVRGEINISATGAPGSGRGAALLVPMGDCSQMSFNGTVEFKVPLVGGTIESYLGGQFAELIQEIQRFTTTWIAERA